MNADWNDRWRDEDDDSIIGMTPSQKAFMRMLTDQRVADLMLASDLIGAMDADMLSLLRAFGSPEHKSIRRFFWQVKPETLKFLTEMREEEIEQLQAAVETYLAVRRTLRVIRWSIVSLFGAFVATLMLWEKIAGMFRGNGGGK